MQCGVAKITQRIFETCIVVTFVKFAKVLGYFMRGTLLSICQYFSKTSNDKKDVLYSFNITSLYMYINFICVVIKYRLLVSTIVNCYIYIYIFFYICLYNLNIIINCKNVNKLTLLNKKNMILLFL